MLLFSWSQLGDEGNGARPLCRVGEALVHICPHLNEMQAIMAYLEIAVQDAVIVQVLHSKADVQKGAEAPAEAWQKHGR